MKTWIEIIYKIKYRYPKDVKMEWNKKTTAGNLFIKALMLTLLSIHLRVFFVTALVNGHNGKYCTKLKHGNNN